MPDGRRGNLSSPTQEFAAFCTGKSFTRKAPIGACGEAIPHAGRSEAAGSGQARGPQAKPHVRLSAEAASSGTKGEASRVATALEIARTSSLETHTPDRGV